MSCEKNQTIQKFKKEIHPDDIDCLNEIKKAENDLKIGIDIYCKNYGMLTNFSEERHTT
jgi:hypothetical protein